MRWGLWRPLMLLLAVEPMDHRRVASLSCWPRRRSWRLKRTTTRFWTGAAWSCPGFGCWSSSSCLCLGCHRVCLSLLWALEGPDGCPWWFVETSVFFGPSVDHRCEGLVRQLPPRKPDFFGHRPPDQFGDSGGERADGVLGRLSPVGFIGTSTGWWVDEGFSQTAVCWSPSACESEVPVWPLLCGGQEEAFGREATEPEWRLKISEEEEPA